MKPLSQKCRHGETGVAAIEFALVFPVLLLMFFGTINIAQYAVELRRIGASSNLVGDLVARSQSTISRATVDDYFTAVELMFRPNDQTWVQTNIGIDVYVYARTAAPPPGTPGPPPAAPVKWSKFYQNTQRCTPPDANMASTNPIGALLPDSDVVVAVVCTTFTAPAANYPGFEYLVNRTIEKQQVSRPRQSLTIDLIN